MNKSILARIDKIEAKLKPKPGENGILRFYEISAADDLAQNQNLSKYDVIIFLPMKSDIEEPPQWEFRPAIENVQNFTQNEDDNLSTIVPKEQLPQSESATRPTQHNEDTPQSGGAITIERIQWRTGTLNQLSSILTEKGF